MTCWWGPFSIPFGEVIHWRIGPLSLWIRHLSQEWRIAHDTALDRLDSRLEIAVPSELTAISATAELTRFASGQKSDSITLAPRLPDRPWICRPEAPFELLAGAEVALYVSTVLWVRIESGTPPVLLTELPCFRPSDTWFGPNTMVGELCYGDRTGAKLDLGELPIRPHRAVTCVILRNRASNSMRLERLNLPVKNLALHRDSQGRLWTDSVILEREPSGSVAQFRIKKNPPPEAVGAEKICDARSPDTSNVFVRALDALLG